MRSSPSSWNTTLTQLGLQRKKRKTGGSQKSGLRKLRMESLEARRVLAASGTFERLDAVVGGTDLASYVFSSSGAYVVDEGRFDGDINSASNSDNFAVDSATSAAAFSKYGKSANHGSNALAQGFILPHLDPQLTITGAVPQLDLSSHIASSAGTSGNSGVWAEADDADDPLSTLDGKGLFRYVDDNLSTQQDMFYGGVHVISAGGGTSTGGNSGWEFYADIGLEVVVGGRVVVDLEIEGRGSGGYNRPTVINYSTLDDADGSSVTAPDGTVTVIDINDADGINLFIYFAAPISNGQNVLFDVYSDGGDNESIISLLTVKSRNGGSASASVSNSVFMFGFAEDASDPQPDWPDGSASSGPSGGGFGGVVGVTDLDGDGDVDEDDALLWKEGQTVPKVTGVAISGPNPLDGVAGTYEIPDGSGEQIRTVPIGGADILEVEFSELINETTLTSPGAFQILEVSGGTADNVTSDFDFRDLTGTTATWDYTVANATDMIPAGQYVLVLNDTIQDLDGKHLDGEWTNPTSLNDTGSTFPSGDGQEFGDFEFYFTILPGDFNRDNSVTAPDVTILTTHFGQSGVGFLQGDITGDGTVNVLDVTPLTVNLGTDFTTWPAQQAAASSGGGGTSLMSPTTVVSATDAAFATLEEEEEGLLAALV